MHLPFLHQSTTLKTVPGTQFYTPTLTSPAGFISPSELKEIDWGSFYILPNEALTAIVNEAHVVAATVVVTNSANWQVDGGVQFTAGPVVLTPTDGDPSAGEYTVSGGTYYFNSADVGSNIQISYTVGIPTTQANPVLPKPLTYMDYDQWREVVLSRDVGANKNAQAIPDYIFRPQIHGQIGLSPIPNKIYTINFEYWITPLELVNTTDMPIVPSRFGQVIIDGAAMYCHKFREDIQMATAMEKKFTAGVVKMRTELINRESTMTAGFYWYPHGLSYTLNTTR